MKTCADLEVAALRAQVRQLRQSVAELENRLAEFDGEDENRWGIWPYCWFVALWDWARHCFHSLHAKRKRARDSQRRAVQNAAWGEWHLN